ncbi:MAG: sugar transferase [Acidobacteria bacterium]|nr:sugar transferase [Acidobacteriota bacterium]
MQRLIDIAASGILLLVLSPLLLVVALLIRFESSGGAFFRQERVGLHGALFTMFKFRTMRPPREGEGVRLATAGDDRITSLGRFLRSSKIDELPQLINVLRGEMTMIGPRAETPNFIPYFTQEQREVLGVKPGLTGPGQIHYTVHQAGRIPEGADANTIYIEEILPEKLAIDLEYVRHRSWRRDLSILGRTLLVVLSLGRRG